jgi:hypothetical protein
MPPINLFFSVALLAAGSSVRAFAPPPSTLWKHVSCLSVAACNIDNVSRRSAVFTLAGLATSPLILPTITASARLEGVNKPELLPSEKGLNVIQVEKFLTKGTYNKQHVLLCCNFGICILIVSPFLYP